MSGFEVVKFTIDGKTYKTTVLDAYQNRGLYLRIVQQVAPALDKLDLTALKGDKPGERETALMKMAAAAIGGVDVRLFEELCDVFGAATVLVEPKGEVQLDAAMMGLHFAKRYSALLQWVIQCCKANGFFDFLSAISSLGQ